MSRFLKIYKFVYEVVIPSMFALHSIVWILFTKFGLETGVGNVILYSWKLFTVIIFFQSLSVIRFSIRDKFSETFVFFVFIIIFFFGLINPLLYGKLNYFYYFADAIGLFSVVYLFWFFRYTIQNGILSLTDLLNPIVNSTIRVSVIIIVYSLITAFDKVSIPPEIHFGLVLSIGLFFIRSNIVKVSLWSFSVVVIGAILSMMRIYLLVLFIVFIYFFVRYVLLNKDFKNKLRILFLFMIVSFVSFNFLGDILSERINSLSLVGSGAITGSSDNDYFEDNSIETRFVEAQFIIKAIKDQPLFFQLFGRGFGAEYEFFGENRHHSHIAYISVLFRNGVLGFALLVVSVFYCTKVFRKEFLTGILGVGALATFIALLTDQYIYYGLHFAVCIALVTLSPKIISNYNA